MSSQSNSNTSSSPVEDRAIFGFGPDHRLPYSCSYCLGTPRMVKQCRPCNGTGLMWDRGSDDVYQRKDEIQYTPGGSSPGSSSLSS
ncbi:uncharacterized protein GGS25DRAFT_519960 [Hypoxylon fragiforme]|uniref:uncharacterized protein n=1 Tax=Hypoxylon fragiforme TaxID=63214 RepID=UPI0020C6AC6D|nr:uncharacterized protein GGS25DRAFT_519960 [Hypoxylon fragiforme]KAI2611648.1 hypothetical protein GGS25DRAFT_519960 [Hypoxylon fragiforme]